VRLFDEILSPRDWSEWDGRYGGRRGPPPIPPQVVAETDWPRLPRSPQNKTLARECFIYNPDADGYYCPLGKKLDHHHDSIRKKTGVEVQVRYYRGAGRAACPIAGDCIKGPRTICRDEYEDLREQARARTQTPQGREWSQRRRSYTEGVFGLIKAYAPG